MESSNNPVADTTPLGRIRANLSALDRQLQSTIDQTTPYVAQRWIGTALLLTLFLIRILYTHGWYIVTYALAIYLLNIFLLFLSPKFDPALEDLDDDGPKLPMKNDEEFRPFIRRLPEFKFWLNATRATLLALFCSFFAIFDVPVFWPVLLVYFIILFSLTMRKQVQHMIKYRYVPFDFGKKKYSPGGDRK